MRDSSRQADLRRHRRVAVELPVTLISTSYGTTHIAPARSVDLSEGGIAVVTSTPLKPYQPLSIEMKLPLQDIVLKLAAEVQHQTQERYGLSFVSPSEAQLNYLRRVVA